MYIENLTLKNFRNYVLQRVTVSPSLNVFTGRNAVGKTNFLEAIYMLGIGKSPRTVKEREVVRFGEDMAYAKAEIVKKYSRHTVEMYIDKADKKRIAIDGLPIKKLGELMGVLGVVYFSPDELGLIKDAPSARRRFLDIALSQQSKSYYYTLGKYNKTLVQRNKLLKTGGDALNATLDIWDETLAREASTVIEYRRRFVQKLSDVAKRIHNEVGVGEDLDIKYQSTIEGEDRDTLISNILKGLRENRERDVYLGFTSVGPHRDDLLVSINGLDSKKYASQGQQRTAALSLKLSELEMFFDEMGEYPILLLDDVLSELDVKRRDKLLSATSHVQTFLTCTHFTANSDVSTVYEVIAGERENKIKTTN